MCTNFSFSLLLNFRAHCFHCKWVIYFFSTMLECSVLDSFNVSQGFPCMVKNGLVIHSQFFFKILLSCSTAKCEKCCIQAIFGHAVFLKSAYEWCCDIRGHQTMWKQRVWKYLIFDSICRIYLRFLKRLLFLHCL